MQSVCTEIETLGSFLCVLKKLTQLIISNLNQGFNPNQGFAAPAPSASALPPFTYFPAFASFETALTEDGAAPQFYTAPSQAIYSTTLPLEDLQASSAVSACNRPADSWTYGGNITLPPALSSRVSPSASLAINDVMASTLVR